jgi:hypothetical protein
VAGEADHVPDLPRQARSGESITAVGGVLPAVMVTEAASVAPWSSVTRSLAV